jgi:PAS domain S-box-containing protein
LKKFNLKLVDKALLLIAVPLLFELCFVITLVYTLKQLEVEYRSEAAANQVLLCVNLVLNNIIDCAGAIGLYQINHDERYLKQLRAGEADLRIRRQQLLQIANQNQRAELATFNTVTDEVINTFEQVQRLIQSNDSLDLMRSTIRIQKLLKQVNESGMKVIQEQALITAHQSEAQAHLRENVERIIIAGVAASMFLALALALYFNRTTATRLAVLSRNALKLAMEQPLEPKLEGSDEIAQIDQVFHAMAVTLAEARQKEQALTQNALDVICSLDAKGRFTNMNHAVETAWGYKKTQLLGQSVFSLMDKDTVQAARQAIEHLADGQPSAPLEFCIRRKDGVMSETSWSIQWSSAEKSFFCVAHDIAERKRIERLRQDVVAMVSHDLRAPLTAIKMTFDLFKLGKLGEVNERGQQKIDKADVQITRMVTMISDLLDIERLDAGAFELSYSEASAMTIVARSIDSVQSFAESRKIGIEVLGSDATLQCDQERIVRTLVNLLHNAVKFAQLESTITIALDHDEQSVKISVSDCGKGIPAEKLDQIFDRFKQLDQADRHSSGLGLAICKAIVKAHQGTIGAQSVPDKGSTFWFTLPMQYKQS